MSKQVVLLVCIGIFFAVLVWDAFLYADNTPGNSISQAIVYYSHRYPLLPWAIGMLMGFLAAHFFDTTTQAAIKMLKGNICG